MRYNLTPGRCPDCEGLKEINLYDRYGTFRCRVECGTCDGTGKLMYARRPALTA